MGILADAKQTLLAALKHPGPRPNENRAAWIAEQHAKQKDFCTPKIVQRPKFHGTGHEGHKICYACRCDHDDHAGSFGQWPQRYIEFDYPDSYISPTLGCMGPRVPSAVAAKLAHPSRMLIAHVARPISYYRAGNGHGQAIGTNIITIVYNNEGYNSIRMHQEAQYPGRQYGVGLQDPDFATIWAINTARWA